MGRKIKVILISSSSVILLLILFFAAFNIFTARSLPKTSGKLKAEGLISQVEIIRDNVGIPHIYAENLHDLFFAQGLVHAQDRYWQMEFWRRIGSGRLSELFGKKQLETDIFLRTMGFARVAQKEWEIMDGESKGFLQAYTDGINAWIKNKKPAKLALEFSLLSLTGVDIDVEPWSPVDSLTWAKVMSFDLGGNISTERLILDILQGSGLTLGDDYFVPFWQEYPVIVSLDEFDDYRRQFGLPPLEEDNSRNQNPNVFSAGGQSPKGSNGWVVSGKFTESGKPLICNDMHLAIQMPSIWYEAALHCSGPEPLHAKGYTFAGVPGVIAGHNEKIAWTQCNGSFDVQDLYFERISRADPDLFWDGNEWKPMEIVYETIEIEGEEEPFILRVRYTDNGPIISETSGYSRMKSYFIEENGVYPENLSLGAVSIRWTALEPGEIMRSIFELNRAENYRDFKEALRYWSAPGQNVLYADVDGNIAYQLSGVAPIRKEGTGYGPMPGWIDDCKWQGYIPYEDMPASFNPDKGFIITANNTVIDQSYKYYLSNFYSFGFRPQRITDLLTDAMKNPLTVEKMAEIQFDNYSLAAQRILFFLHEQDFTSFYDDLYPVPDDETEKEKKKREKVRNNDLELMEESITLLKEWDFYLKRESPEAVLYSYFLIELGDAVFEDQFNREFWPQHPGGRLKTAYFHLLEDPRNKWWDNINSPDRTEERDEILAEAFVRAVVRTRKELGDKITKWEWGDVHSAEFRNQTLGESGISLIENLFNRGPVPVDGGNNQVNVMSWEVEDPFNVYHVASQRSIIDMADLSNSLLIHTTGQSGHPASSHYDDFIPLWQNGEYHGNPWTEDQVRKEADKVLKLIPTG